MIHLFVCMDFSKIFYVSIACETGMNYHNYIVIKLAPIACFKHNTFVHLFNK